MELHSLEWMYKVKVAVRAAGAEHRHLSAVSTEHYCCFSSDSFSVLMLSFNNESSTCSLLFV